MHSLPTAARCVSTTVITSLLTLAGITSACEGRSPSDVTPLPAAPVAPPLAVVSILPNMGSTVRPTAVTIRGTGFLFGATVTLDAAATNISVLNDRTIEAVAPAHAASSVNVVVTNPGGQSAQLVGAFTYAVEQPYTLVPSRSAVVAGGDLSVIWTAPRGGAGDWVGLFEVTDPSTNYEPGRWTYTRGATSGTLALQAPSTPGLYEFRYLLDDGYVDVVRSTTVNVTAQ